MIPSQTTHHSIYSLNVLPKQTPQRKILLPQTFERIKSIHLSDLDDIVNGVFEKTIKTYETAEMPFFIALVKDANNKIRLYLASDFVDELNAKTVKIKNAYIYQVDRLANNNFKVKNLCTKEEFEEKKEYYTKYIHACNLEREPKMRGADRTFLGYLFKDDRCCKLFDLKSDLEKSFFWFKKSTEDNIIDGWLYLADHYNNLAENASSIEERDINKRLFLKHLEVATTFDSPISPGSPIPPKETVKLAYQHEWTRHFITKLSEKELSETQ